MRPGLQILLMIVVALLVATIFQVLIAQSNEAGSFGDRVVAVVTRQLGLDQVARTTDEATGRGAGEGTDPSGAIQSIRLGDMTAADLQTLIRDSTREELEALQHELSLEADRRDASGFWTDVRLNALFLFLSALVPMIVRRSAAPRP